MMPMNPICPNALDAIVLLGWMSEADAVSYLKEVCYFDPPLSAEDAKCLWRKYRDAVLALGRRDATAPARMPITNFYESQAADKILKQARATGVKNILDVIRIDPMDLVAWQPYVVTERSDRYRSRVDSSKGWISEALLCSPRSPNLQIRHAMNAIDVEVPHMEWGFVFDPQRGFQIQQFARHVTTTAYGNRMMLWAGYHRSYARMANMAPDAMDRSLVVVLTTDGDFMVSAASPNQGVRDMLVGDCPPLFRDFFDERFFMKVKLRKKRYELQIRAKLVAIDA